MWELLEIRRRTNEKQNGFKTAMPCGKHMSPNTRIKNRLTGENIQ